MTGKIQRNKDVLATEIDDVLLVLSVEKGMYFGMRGVGPHIWELLETPTTPEAMVQQLLTEYDIEPDACAEQVDTFINGLRVRGLLTELE